MEVMLQAHPDIINHCKIDDGYTALHAAVHFDHCDELCYFAAMVRMNNHASVCVYSLVLESELTSHITSPQSIIHVYISLFASVVCYLVHGSR